LCFLKRKCQPKSVSCFPASFHLSLSFNFSSMHSFTPYLLLFIQSSFRFFYSPSLLLSILYYSSKGRNNREFFHSISSVLSSFLLSFLPFIPPSLPRFFCPSIIYLLLFYFPRFSLLPSFLAFLFLPSFLRCFLSSLFSPYFELNSFPPAFLYGNRGRANTVDSKSRRRTSVY